MNAVRIEHGHGMESARLELAPSQRQPSRPEDKACQYTRSDGEEIGRKKAARSRRRFVHGSSESSRTPFRYLYPIQLARPPPPPPSLPPLATSCTPFLTA